MKSLVTKVAALLPKLESRGPVYFYALIEREDVSRWDVTLSAEWSDTNYTAAIRFVADALVPTLDPSELSVLSGVVILPSSGLDFQALPASFEQTSPRFDAAINLMDTSWGTRRMFVIKVRKPALDTTQVG